MANPKIEVEIGAVTTGLVRGVDGAILSLGQLEKELKQVGDELKTSIDPTRISQLNNRFQELTNGAKQLRTTGIDPLTKATSNYNSVGTDFARIIQDAPFGIIGVGNNITQLAGSFQQLRASSTSTGAALKTALGSILSPANALVLGVSLLTTAFTVLQQNGFFKTKESAEDSEEALSNYRKSLDAVTRSSIEAAASAQREVQSFSLLRAQAENANVPLSKRIEAVNELKRQYPEYLGNLTKEQILTGNVGNAYNQLTNQIIASAKARAASDQIAKNSLSILTIEQQTQERVTSLLEKRQKLETLQALAANQAAKSRGEFTGLDLQILDLQSEIANLSKEQVASIEEINKFNKDNLALTSQISKQIEQGATFTNTQVQSTKTLSDEVGKILASEDKISQAIESQNKLRNESLAKLKALSEASKSVEIKNVDVGLPSAPPVSETAPSAPGGIQSIADVQSQIASLEKLRQVTTDPEALKRYTEQIKALKLELNTLADQESAQLLVDTFSTIGNAIGNSLNIADNALRSFVSTLLSNTPKIISAISAQANATDRASKRKLIANKKDATGNAIVTATEGAKGLGPVGLALLPVFIGGAVALISKAFGGGGGGGGGASVGGGISAGTGASFTGGSSTSLAGVGQDTSFNLYLDGTQLNYQIEQTRIRNQRG